MWEKEDGLTGLGIDPLRFPGHTAPPKLNSFQFLASYSKRHNPRFLEPALPNGVAAVGCDNVENLVYRLTKSQRTMAQRRVL